MPGDLVVVYAHGGDAHYADLEKHLAAKTSLDLACLISRPMRQIV